MSTLWVVATPIGNLEDLSPRAARVLAESSVVAAESVQRTRKLLSSLGISGKKLLSCREANRNKAAAQVVGHLKAGRDVALVSDAGTPGISDPAAAVVEAAREAGYKVSPIPGPSALAALLSVAGLANPKVLFLGFLPAKAGARRRMLQRAAQGGWALVIYEAPHRLAALAHDMVEVLGDRPLVMGRELSKVHEEVVRTTCAELAERAASEKIKGEVSLLVFGDEEAGKKGPVANDEEVDGMLSQGLAEGKEKPSALARRVAAQSGWTKDQVYRRLMNIKQGNNPGGE